MRARSFLITACVGAVLSVAVPAAAEPLKQVKVVCDRAPDCSSLNSIVDSVTRGCKTDDERAVAIYNFVRYVNYHFAYPTEPGGISALKLLNVYGWSLCGGQHAMLSSLWEAAGWEWRFRGWPGHTTVEAFYGGRWHYFDTFLKFYTWMPDPNAPGGRTVAGQLDINANPMLVTDAFVMDPARKVCYHKDNRFEYVGDKANWTAPAFMVCGDTLDGVLSGCRASNRAGSPRGWGGIKFDDPEYSTDVNLAPGYALTLDWNKIEGAWYHAGRKEHPRHTCGDKDYRNCPATGPILEPYHELGRARTYSNGTLVFRPDFGSDAVLGGFAATENVVYRDGGLQPQDAAKAGAVVVEMASPYVAVKARAEIDCDAAKVELSEDGTNYKPVDAADFSVAVLGKYRYFVRVTFQKPLRGLTVETIVQHNQEALPFLAPGDNKITVTAANPEALGKNRLVVTYAYCRGARDRTPEEVLDRDAEIARAHYAAWDSTAIVVQKTFTRLPAVFEIPVPTPKDKQPVYPRMVFLRREVLAPGQEALPVPAAPSEPKVGPGEVLAKLPNPWTIGAAPPPKRDDRPVEKVTLAPTKLNYVSKQGEVFSHQFIKWLKDNSDAWVLLMDFDTGKLPDPKKLAGAKLVVYVEEAHDKAPMQAAAVMLDAPFTPGEGYDFSKLGQTAGFTIVARGNGPGAPFTPPRRCEIDVSRAVRAWARGEPNHGLALRIVPNRGVDDGWTVRFTPPKEKPVELVVETYAD